MDEKNNNSIKIIDARVENQIIINDKDKSHKNLSESPKYKF